MLTFNHHPKFGEELAAKVAALIFSFCSDLEVTVPILKLENLGMPA
jgi:hypothetical protein